MWIEGNDHLRLHVRDDSANRRFDVEHVHVRQRVRVVAPLPLFSCRVVKPEQHRLLDAEPCARQLELFDAQRAKVVDRTDGWMRLAGLSVGGAGKRDAHSPFAEVREHAAVEDLVVGMREDDQE